MKTIPNGLHCMDADDFDAVNVILKGDWFTQGQMIERFEEEVVKCGGGNMPGIAEINIRS